MVHKITYRDIYTIVSTAKEQVATQPLPLIVSNQIVTGYEQSAVAMIETVIMYLNSKGLLNEVPEIDRKDRG